MHLALAGPHFNYHYYYYNLLLKPCRYNTTSTAIGLCFAFTQHILQSEMHASIQCGLSMHSTYMSSLYAGSVCCVSTPATHIPLQEVLSESNAQPVHHCTCGACNHECSRMTSVRSKAVSQAWAKTRPVMPCLWHARLMACLSTLQSYACLLGHHLVCGQDLLCALLGW